MDSEDCSHMEKFWADTKKARDALANLKIYRPSHGSEKFKEYFTAQLEVFNDNIDAWTRANAETDALKAVYDIGEQPK